MPAPYPPFDLANRVCCLDGRGDAIRAYEELGSQTRDGLVGLLPDDWSFEGKRMLDFGCGAGRTLRHFLPEARHAEFWGVDIDLASIEWLQKELCPPLHVRTAGIDPPLGLASGSFDLIWALSVFTHLTDSSLPWLLELHRLLKPGGLLVATYMGRWNSEVLAGEPWEEDRVGMNVLRHGQSWDIGGPMVLMSDWWVREHWGRAFDVVEIAPNIHNQSWALLRARDVDLTVADLERPGDDARELAALRHNLRQVQREAAQPLEAIRTEYERSISWQITRPLRAAAAKARSVRAARRSSVPRA